MLTQRKAKMSTTWKELIEKAIIKACLPTIDAVKEIQFRIAVTERLNLGLVPRFKSVYDAATAQKELLTEGFEKNLPAIYLRGDSELHPNSKVVEYLDKVLSDLPEDWDALVLGFKSTPGSKVSALFEFDTRNYFQIYSKVEEFGLIVREGEPQQKFLSFLENQDSNNLRIFSTGAPLFAKPSEMPGFRWPEVEANPDKTITVEGLVSAYQPYLPNGRIILSSSDKIRLRIKKDCVLKINAPSQNGFDLKIGDQSLKVKPSRSVTVPIGDHEIEISGVPHFSFTHKPIYEKDNLNWLPPFNISHVEESWVRLPRLKEHLAKVGMTNYRIVPAHNGFRDSQVHSPPIAARSQGHYGCAVSKTEILIDNSADGEPGNIVFFGEDDVRFALDWKEKLLNAMKYLPEDWEVLHLGAFLQKGETRIGDANSNLYVTDDANCFPATMFKGNRAQKLFCDFFYGDWKSPDGEQFYACDWWFARMCREHKIVQYCIKPQIATQTEGYSLSELNWQNHDNGGANWR